MGFHSDSAPGQSALREYRRETGYLDAPVRRAGPDRPAVSGARRKWSLSPAINRVNRLICAIERLNLYNPPTDNNPATKLPGHPCVRRWGLRAWAILINLNGTRA